MGALKKKTFLDHEWQTQDSNANFLLNLALLLKMYNPEEGLGKWGVPKPGGREDGKDVT